jgi:hypothetical protein
LKWKIIVHIHDHGLSMGPNLHWYWSVCYKSRLESKLSLLLIGRKRYGLISFVGGNAVEVRVKQPKISTHHKRCIREE